MALLLLSQASCSAGPGEGEEGLPLDIGMLGSELSGSAPVVVSLTFDDTVANQYTARDILKSHGMQGTFYLNSPRIGVAGYLSQQQVQDLVSDGNEIGSHTLSHPHLPALEASEQRREMCNDRVALMNMFAPTNPGFSVNSIAYPYGEFSGVTQEAASACGFTSGRGTGGLCGTCSTAAAEAIPPASAMNVRSYGSVQSTTPVSTITGWITNARANGGGWVPIIFHHICTNCGQYAMTAANFDALLTWIQSNAAAMNIQVRTVNQVMGVPAKPLVFGPVANDSLEKDVNPADGLADCWQRGRFGTNTVAWSRTPDGHSGASAETMTISSFTSGNRKLVTRQDLGICAPPARPGHSYSVSGWYKGSGQARMVAYYRDTGGVWRYWSNGPALAASSTWAQATFTTPVAPSVARGLSFGLSLESAGSLTMDDFAVVEN